jgi:molybdate transport system regulatory protein
MLQACLSIRVDLPGGHRIGPGKIQLLETIEESGSISAAARKIGMSYRRAWLLVEAINDALIDPAVETKAGGNTHGGATLTASGRKLVNLYRSIERDARTKAGQDYKTMNLLMRKPPAKPRVARRA